MEIKSSIGFVISWRIVFRKRFLPYTEAKDFFQANSKAIALRGKIYVYMYRFTSYSQVLLQLDVGLNHTNNIRSTLC